MFYRTLEEFKNSCGYFVNGFWYPRVTSIVSMKAKPALYKFYGELESFEQGEQIKAKSAEEGTLIHDLVEKILAGQSPAIPDSVRPALAAFQNFLSHNQVKALKIEERLISKNHRYSGTLDVLAEINGRPGVLDIKTSYAVFRDYGLQTAAYVEALREAEGWPTLTRWILRLDQSQNCQFCGAVLRTKGGREKVRKENRPCEHVWGEMLGEAELKELSDYQSDFKAFLACKTLWEWEHEFWLKRLNGRPLRQEPIL